MLFPCGTEDLAPTVLASLVGIRVILEFLVPEGDCDTAEGVVSHLNDFVHVVTDDDRTIAARLEDLISVVIL